MESFQSGNILVKLAQTEEEKKGLWKLRYFDLILEYDKDKVSEIEEDKDEYDEVCDHLIAIDLTTNEVVGSYRLIKKSHIKNIGKFLSEEGFNLEPLNKYELLEVGRAVVKEEYRDSAIINLLWKGLIKYAVSEEVEYMIGSASFHGNNPSDYKETLSYLYDNYLSPEEIRCKVNGKSSSPLKLVDNYDEEQAKKGLPPVIKGYLRLGATIGDGAYIDVSFNSVDVLIVLKIKEINERYLRKFLS